MKKWNWSNGFLVFVLVLLAGTGNKSMPILTALCFGAVLGLILGLIVAYIGKES